VHARVRVCICLRLDDVVVQQHLHLVDRAALEDVRARAFVRRNLELDRLQ
jgi:hypothetical protein